MAKGGVQDDTTQLANETRRVSPPQREQSRSERRRKWPNVRARFACQDLSQRGKSHLQRLRDVGERVVSVVVRGGVAGAAENPFLDVGFIADNDASVGLAHGLIRG